MNKTEAAFAAHLETCKRGHVWAQRGHVYEWYEFEPMRLILGHRCSYTPDFAALDDEGQLYFFEVKGFWRDDARVKIKAAARRFPMFRFVAVTLVKKTWNYEHIKP